MAQTIDDPEMWDGKRMAWHLGVSPRRLRQLVEDGVIEPTLIKQGRRGVRRYEPMRTARRYYEFLLRSKRAPTAEEVVASKQRYESARADLTAARDRGTVSERNGDGQTDLFG